jgi:hypothetical protein
LIRTYAAVKMFLGTCRTPEVSAHYLYIKYEKNLVQKHKGGRGRGVINIKTQQFQSKISSGRIRYQDIW